VHGIGGMNGTQTSAGIAKASYISCVHENFENEGKFAI
jgi:hypothetical protein